MSDTAQTEQHVWHNPCCLALLDMDPEDRPAHWVCDTCGADWRYDQRAGAHGPGFNEYWQHAKAQEMLSMMRSIDRGIIRLEKNTGRQQYAIVKEPTLTRWQHLKAALKP